ncbi:unnamed protein product [Colias eurytheme]|nr:unnamed protein product [Colias eurytheme]
MILLLILALMQFDPLECSKPRSVNLALETVLEFDKDADLALLDTVQGFLTKVKSTIEETRLNADTRRTNSVSFTDILEQLIFILQSYNDIDFTTLLESIFEEINNIDLSNCDNDDEETNFLSFLHDRLADFKKTPVNDVRRNLDDVLRKMRDDEYKKESALFSFLDTFLKKRSQDKFQNILNHLQLFRRHHNGANVNLRSIVRKSINLVITDYYCQLDRGQKREIKQLVKPFLSSKSKIKSKRLKKKPKLRIEIRDRTKKTPRFNNKYKYSKLKHIRDKSEHTTEEDDSKTIQIYKPFRGVQKTKDDNSKFIQSFFNKHDRESINSQKIKVKTEFDNESEIPIEGSKEFIKIRKRKAKTTKQSKREYDKPNEYKSRESGEYKKKRKRFKIKNGRTSKSKQENQIIKSTQNLQLVSRHANSEKNINKELLQKLLSKNDDTEYGSKSNDELPVWKKYTKKRATNKLKTFITLYPERIDIYRANTITERGEKELDAERKRFTIEPDKDSKDTYKIITTHAEIDIDIDKSLIQPDSFFKSIYPENKRYKESSQRKQRRKKTKQRTKSKMDNVFRGNENNAHTFIESSSTTGANYDSDSVEYFGSLYNHNNKNKEIKGYRKSNDKDELKITTTVVPDNITTVSTDKAENVTNPAKYETKYNSQSEEVTETFGTLAFWDGTNEPSTIKLDAVTENLEILNTTNITTKYFKIPEEEKLQLNVSTTEIVFRSQDLNDTRDSRKSSFVNDTFKFNVTEAKSSNLSNINVTSELNNIISTTTVKENNAINKINETIATKATKPFLRRYLDNIAINEVDDDKKTRIKSKIQEDLKKLFMIPTSKTTLKDPIDELEEAFNL